MRVVQVSAHYPPNHVSGGTLVPQRLARGLAARGHEVFVYAGHLDEHRRPLETWTEDDGEGVQVRWIVTTPWTAWADPRNSVNPPVGDDFARWIEEVRPDVVHLHSLQTLGGELVEVAKRAGAAVVVTMHDFWWTCARQFLVAPDMRPCSLVVDCGTCPCAGGHTWLERRNAVLARYLRHADVVLAPSASAAAVLEANGVDSARLRVDENGVPAEDLVGTPVARAADDDEPHPVRLLFAGAPDPMKGIDVLLRAVDALPSDGSWTLDVYGVPERGRHRPEVRFHPRYGRDEVAEVFASHDVLVLPSVMRESYSIVTREALGSGLAVVCTDTLGPEEVVRDGENGLVVPAGDADSLAAALRRLAASPELVRRLRGATQAVPIRTVDEQLDHVEEVYRELVEGEGPALLPEERTVEVDAGLRSLVNRVLVVVGIRGAALRYRGRLPAEALRMRGFTVDVRHYRDPEIVELADRADVVVLYRVPATVQVADLVDRVRARDRAVPVLFDVDDLIFDPELEGEVHGLHVLSEEEHALWWRGVARYRTTLEMCDAYVGSTEALCAHVTTVTGIPSHRFANGVGQALAQVSDEALARPRTPGPLRIGYFSGTNTHDADWAAVEPAVVRVLATHPTVELWLGGQLGTGPALEEFGDRVRRLPMLPWYELPHRLRDVDVNLAPLVLDNRFNEAKSAIKWLEAALVETPTVASPTQPFREAVEHGVTGMLATDEESWFEAITTLLDDPLARRRTGSRARRDALLRWGPHAQGERYEDILTTVWRARAADGPRAASGWEPVLDDEPLDSTEGWLDPYPGIPSGSADHLRELLLRVPGGSKVVAAGRVLRSDGPGAVVRRTAFVVRRKLVG